MKKSQGLSMNTLVIGALALFILLILAIAMNKFSFNQNPSDNKLGIIFSFDEDGEEDNMLTMLDMSWVFVQELNVTTVEEAIEITKSYNGVCRHYSTILYQLLYNKLNRSEVYLISGYMYFINGSDMFTWDDRFKEDPVITPEYITNHQWVYDAEYGIIDIMEEISIDNEGIPVRVPVLVINEWDEWGHRTDLLNCNLRTLYQYELGIYDEKTGFPEINESDLRGLVMTTEEWYQERTNNNNYWMDKRKCK